MSFEENKKIRKAKDSVDAHVNLKTRTDCIPKKTRNSWICHFEDFELLRMKIKMKVALFS